MVDGPGNEGSVVGGINMTDIINATVNSTLVSAVQNKSFFLTDGTNITADDIDEKSVVPFGYMVWQSVVTSVVFSLCAAQAYVLYKMKTKADKPASKSRSRV